MESKQSRKDSQISLLINLHASFTVGMGKNEGEGKIALNGM